jgi:hypothetical protein
MKKVLPVFCIFISLFTALLAVFFLTDHINLRMERITI